MNRMRTLAAILITVSLFAAGSQVADPKTGIAVMKKSFGLDDCYQFAVYPIDNFGVGTAYNFKPGQPTTDQDFICATFSCLDISPAPAVGTDAWMNINGYATPAQGGSLTLHSDSKSTYGTGVVLPGIMKLIKADFSADFTKNVTVDITIPGGTKRLLDRKQFGQEMDKLQPTDPMKKAFLNGTLDYVVGDLVVPSITMTIKVDGSKNIKADATLTAAKGILDKDASLNMKMDTSGAGNYTLTVSKPVILAYCHRRQPGAGAYAQRSDWDDWAAQPAIANTK